MSKMGSHDPFGHLKHKLWPKERPGIKLAIWLSTTKSWESPRFPCVKVACHIPLERSQQELQFFFKHNFNKRFSRKVMCLQNRRSPNFGNFKTLIWESRDKMSFGCWPMAKHTIYYKGEGGGFPQVRVMVSFVNLNLPMVHSCTKNAQTMH
jgi:hypothetical protein